MLFDDHTILAAYCADYLARNLTGCIRHFTQDIVFAVYLSPGIVNYGGVTIGRNALLRRLRQIDAQIEVLEFRVASAQQTTTDLHGSIHFHFRHRTTSDDITGSVRILAQLRGGRICRFEAYHDRARFEAFFRLIEFRKDEGDDAGA